MEPLPPDTTALPPTLFDRLLALSQDAFNGSCYDVSGELLHTALHHAKRTNDEKALGQVEEVATRHREQVGQVSLHDLYAEDEAAVWRESYTENFAEQARHARWLRQDLSIFDRIMAVSSYRETHAQEKEMEQKEQREFALAWAELQRAEGNIPLSVTEAANDDYQDVVPFSAPPVSDQAVTAQDAAEWDAMRPVEALSDDNVDDCEDLYFADEHRDDLAAGELPPALLHPDAPRDLHQLQWKLCQLFLTLISPDAKEEPNAQMAHKAPPAEVWSACDAKASQVRILMGRYLGGLIVDYLRWDPSDTWDFVSFREFWVSLSQQIQDPYYGIPDPVPFNWHRAPHRHSLS